MTEVEINRGSQSNFFSIAIYCNGMNVGSGIGDYTRACTRYFFCRRRSLTHGDILEESLRQ